MSTNSINQGMVWILSIVLWFFGILAWGLGRKMVIIAWSDAAEMIERVKISCLYRLLDSIGLILIERKIVSYLARSVDHLITLKACLMQLIFKKFNITFHLLDLPFERLSLFFALNQQCIKQLFLFIFVSWLHLFDLWLVSVFEVLYLAWLFLFCFIMMWYTA